MLLTCLCWLLADGQCRVPYCVPPLVNTPVQANLQAELQATAGGAQHVPGAVATETAVFAGQGVSAPTEATAPVTATATAPGAALSVLTTAAVEVPPAAAPAATAAAAEVPAYSEAMQEVFRRMPKAEADVLKACMQGDHFRANMAQALRFMGASADIL